VEELELEIHSAHPEYLRKKKTPTYFLWIIKLGVVFNV
jgi:hypothetical protein